MNGRSDAMGTTTYAVRWSQMALTISADFTDPMCVVPGTNGRTVGSFGNSPREATCYMLERLPCAEGLTLCHEGTYYFIAEILDDMIELEMMIEIGLSPSSW